MVSFACGLQACSSLLLTNCKHVKIAIHCSTTYQDFISTETSPTILQIAEHLQRLFGIIPCRTTLQPAEQESLSQQAGWSKGLQSSVHASFSMLLPVLRVVTPLFDICATTACSARDINIEASPLRTA